MLFYLTDSLIVDQTDPIYNDIFKAIQNISVQVIDSRHLLAGDFNVIKHFRAVFKDNPIIGPLFNDLYQNFSTKGVPEQLTFYMEVVLKNPTKRTEGTITICQKLYSHFLILDHTLEARMVCEDLFDAEFYQYILSWFIKTKGCNCSFAFHNQGGGGGNIFRAVEEELSKKHITLCIVDTDKKYQSCPYDPKGTYGRCLSVDSAADEYKLLPIEVHEIENLVPLNFIDIAFPLYTEQNESDKRNKRHFDYLRKDAENLLPFFDYKKGIRKDKFFDDNSEYRDFAKKCYSLNVEKTNKEADFDTYINRLKSKEVYPNLIGGTGTIKMALSLINGDRCPQPDLLVFQNDNWMKIGQTMLDWCISRDTESIH